MSPLSCCALSWCTKNICSACECDVARVYVCGVIGSEMSGSNHWILRTPDPFH